jgi:hypothetical protein
MTRRSRSQNRDWTISATAIPRVSVLPPIRCGHQLDDSALSACGASARWMRIGFGGHCFGFRCDDHKRDNDSPLPAAFAIRHVSVKADLVFAGTTFVPELAEREGVELARRGAESVGGLLNLHDVRSYVGQWTAPAPPAGGNGSRGDR